MHIFLTGSKQVGKSTLLSAILSVYPGKAGGFRTVRRDTFLPGQYTVHLLPLNGSQEPTQENLLFVCGKPDDGIMERFNRLGCQALADSADAQLLVMDELGPNEADAAAFQQAVLDAVNGDIPILGVLQEADSDFLKRIRYHPKSCVLIVTEKSRDDLATRVPQIINILTERYSSWQEKH